MGTTLSHIGLIDENNLEEYFDGEAELNGRTVSIDINFEDTTIEPGKLQIVEAFLADLPALERLGKAAIAVDYESGDTVKEYIGHHLEELEEEQVDELVKAADPNLPREKQLVSILKLARAGFYPHQDDNFVTLDFTIDEELTQYLIVVELTSKGDVNYITMES